ncbi:TcmI family type II polyketide cyclase [Actinomadura chokoriensis]|uniref:TcmI family type II polyketide cyclase n=1 Tax=Actinomadura chokoriensis TaxID=454156 RepID=A0ABV4R3E6_9ACTN
MQYNILMIGRVEPGNEAEIAKVFGEHDASELPREIGARRRTLYSFNGLYLHLVESDIEFRAKLYENRLHPLFQETNRRMKDLITPYDPRYPTMRDAEATPFYSWSAG